MSSPTTQRHQIPVSRPMVLFLAVVCFSAAGLIWVLRPDAELWLSGFLRVGILMLAFWLALPTRSRQAAWAHISPLTLVVVLLVIFLVSRYKWMMIPAALAVGILAVVVRPRKKHRP